MASDTFCNLCMITKLMNKWMFTFWKCNCHSFTLCLPYAKLTSHSTRHMQISNDVKLIMANGTYQELWGLDPWHSGGIRQMWVWPSPMWKCSTSTTLPTSQPGTTTGNAEWPYEEVGWQRWASWGWTPATSTPREGFVVLRLSGNSPTSLCWCD
jgi:hypothetical protein